MEKKELWQLIAGIVPPENADVRSIERASIQAEPVARRAAEGIKDPYERKRAMLSAGVTERNRILGAA